MNSDQKKPLQIWRNARIATMDASLSLPYGLLEDSSLVIEHGHIVWLGKDADLPQQFAHQNAVEHDAAGALMTPALIDCHTHLVYSGHRAHEFELRLQGAGYEEIARNGGGIVSTVNATRAASEDELFAQSLPRLQALMQEGVRSVEIKSGYGLSLEHEAKCLRVAKRLGLHTGITVKTTFLGAHALPPEFAGRSDDYIDSVISMLPFLANENLVDSVDVFCERIGFTLDQTERVFQAAKTLNLPVKLHAEQLSDMNGAALAAKYQALSCDHLEHLSEGGARAMAASGTVAVLLPGAFYFLRDTQLPPVQLLRDLKIPIAISTDCNPGSSPCTSLLLMLNMACTLFRLTPEEALMGVTINAAKALGQHDRGVLQVGRRADCLLWNLELPAQISYGFGIHALPKIITVE